MIDKVNIDETIELFVKGKLTEPALSEFKNLMFEDKSIANEVKLQRVTTDAIKESRRMALKTRLEGINVTNLNNTASNPSTFAKFFSLKSIGIVVATVGVGVSSYFFTQNQIDSANDTDLTSNQSLIQDSITQSTDINSNETTGIIASGEEIPTTENNLKDEPLKINLEEVVLSKSNKKSIFSSKKKSVAANGEAMLDQKFDDGSDVNIASTDPQTPATNNTEDEALHASEVDIKNVQDGKYNFHYMLKESTLFLYGNFDATPYEILEFNEKEQQSFYLYYNQSFFALKNGQTDPMKLRKITDTKLVQSLIDARNKKH